MGWCEVWSEVGVVGCGVKYERVKWDGGCEVGVVGVVWEVV